MKQEKEVIERLARIEEKLGKIERQLEKATEPKSQVVTISKDAAKKILRIGYYEHQIA